MLDGIERRRFLVQPAREDAVPAPVAFAHVDLDEGAGQLLLLPRSGRFARPKPNDNVFPPRRLARVKRDILDYTVALVEDSEDRDSLRHRSYVGLAGAGSRLVRRRLILLLGAAPARNQREANEQRCGKLSHAYSGIHGS
jgi:hypothetical protein